MNLLNSFVGEDIEDIEECEERVKDNQVSNQETRRCSSTPPPYTNHNEEHEMY